MNVEKPDVNDTLPNVRPATIPVGNRIKSRMRAKTTAKQKIATVGEPFVRFLLLMNVERDVSAGWGNDRIVSVGRVRVSGRRHLDGLPKRSLSAPGDDCSGRGRRWFVVASCFR